MNPDQHVININAIDADTRKRQRVLALLMKLSVSKNVPSAVRLQATQLHLAVDSTWRVGKTDVWVKEQWARYMVGGSLHLTLLAVLVVLLVLHSHPWLAMVGSLAVGYLVWVGTRELKRRRVLRSRKLPKVGK